MATKRSATTIEQIEKSIYVIRGCKVLLDADLALLYGITTANLQKVVRRSLGRFPSYLMFQLTFDEEKAFRFQTGISKLTGRGGRRNLPYAFTEEGVAMLSSILGTTRAIRVQREATRAFLRPSTPIRIEPTRN
jgi:hypothetical protein